MKNWLTPIKRNIDWELCRIPINKPYQVGDIVLAKTYITVCSIIFVYSGITAIRTSEVALFCNT